MEVKGNQKSLRRALHRNSFKVEQTQLVFSFFPTPLSPASFLKCDHDGWAVTTICHHEAALRMEARCSRWLDRQKEGARVPDSLLELPQPQPAHLQIYFFPFFLRFYLFIFREGEGREKEGERNINVRLPLALTIGDLDCYSGLDWGFLCPLFFIGLR